MTGSAVQWVGEFLGLADPARDAAALAATVADAGGVYFVPAMVGLGAPYWDADARGTIAGLGRSHTAAHWRAQRLMQLRIRLPMCSLPWRTRRGSSCSELHADGGATRNGLLMQFQADILGRPVLRSGNEELSALGAAWLAGLALGWWSGLAEIEALPHPADQFAPAMTKQSAERFIADGRAAFDVRVLLRRLSA